MTDYVAKHREQCRVWLAEHELLSEEYWDCGRGARWLIGRPGTRARQMEIIAGWGGSLVVHGDWPVVKFGHFGDSPDAWARLLWLADTDDTGYYARQKADIGMTGIELDEYEPDVAEEHLADRIRLVREEAEAGQDDSLAEDLQYLVHAKDALTDDREELLAYLYQHVPDFVIDHGNIGMVPGYRVIVAHVALQVCARLLRARHGDAGPSAGRVAPGTASH